MEAAYNKLKKLKDQLDDLNERYQTCLSLNKQLIEIEKNMMMLEKEIKGRQRLILNSTSQTLETNLKILKQQKRGIDARLDQMGDLDEKAFKETRTHLIEKALVLPHQIAAYQNFQKISAQAQIKKERCLILYQFLLELFESFTIIVQTRQKIKGFGIRHYFLSRSPNLIIAQQFLRSHQLIDHFLPTLNQTIEQIHTQTIWNLYSNVKILITEIQPHLNRTWGFSKLDQFFYPSWQKINDFIKQTEKKLEIIQEIEEQFQADYTSWLEKI